MPPTEPIWEKVSVLAEGKHLISSCLAKKIKADLIQKAKVKQRYYKEQRKQQSSPAHDSILQEQRDEGRFAPESDQSNEPLHLVTSGKISRRGNNAHAQMEALQEQKKEQAKIAEKEAQRLIQGGVTHRMEKKTVPSPSGETSLSREEQAKKRQRRQEHYHRQSGSRIGRQRGQPNLGARVDLLLDKIKQS